MNNHLFLISDAHVKNRLWTNNSLVVGDSYEALNIIKEAQVRPGYNYLISCGDLFDVFRPTSKDLFEVCDFISSFDKVYYIDGNHDRVDPSLLQLWSEKCVKLTSTAVEFQNLLLYGVSYCTTKEDLFYKLSEIRLDIERFEKYPNKQPVIILHQALKEFLGFDGSYMCSCDEILSVIGQNCKVYCGDIHEPAVHKPKYGGGFVCSPGPLVPQDIGQAVKHQYYYKLDTTTGDYTQVPIKVRDIAICYDLASLTAALSDASEKDGDLTPLIYAQLPAGVAAPKIPEDVAKQKIVIIRRTSNKQSEQTQRAPQSSSITLRDAIIQDIQSTQKKPDKLIALAGVLMDAQEPDTVLDALLQKIGVTNASS